MKINAVAAVFIFLSTTTLIKAVASGSPAARHSAQARSAVPEIGKSSQSPAPLLPRPSASSGRDRILEQIRFADQFQGSDIGAKANAAIADVGCGTVVIPAGIYDFRTTIIKPRCIVLEGQGPEATVLKYTGEGGAAVVMADLSQQTYAGGGIRDLTIAAPGGTYGAGNASIGLFLGGDPAGNLSPASAFAENQLVTSVAIHGFGTAVEFGSNAWLNTFFHVSLWANKRALAAQNGIVNSGELNTFEDSVIFDNALIMSGIGAEVELRFSGVSFDYNNNGANATIIGSSFHAIRCWFEQSAGPFLDNSSGSGAFISDSLFSYTGTASLPWLLAQGGDESTLELVDDEFSARSPVSALIHETARGSYWLRVVGPVGNANGKISSILQNGFTPGPSAYISVDAYLKRARPIAFQSTRPEFLNGAQFYNSATVPALELTDTSGTPNPHKFLRSLNGRLQILNSAADSVLAEVDDSGDGSFHGSVSTGPGKGFVAYGARAGSSTLVAPDTDGGTSTLPQGSGTLAYVLATTTGRIGGSPLYPGACTAVTVPLKGAGRGMAVAISPDSDPGEGLSWEGWISSPGRVTVRVCNISRRRRTPSAQEYNVRVVQ
jgi:hypothetical protein